MQLIPFYRHAFVRHAPRRYAVMQPPGSAKKYDDHRGQLTDAMLARQLAGEVTYAVPAVEAGLAHLLPFDIDAGGLAAIQALNHAARERGLWGFGQYTPRAGLPDDQQHGYYWLVFDDLVNAPRLQLLGQELIAQVQQPGWTIESRATGADTRLPMTRHTHTGRFGYLVLDHTLIDIDADPDQAWATLRGAFHENPTAQLPPPPAPSTPAIPPARSTSHTTDIARFNAEHDLVDLLTSAGAKPAGRRMFLCPFHDDHHASLAIYRNRAGILVCHCKSTHSNCSLAERPGNDAFRVYCLREQFSEAEALARLNRHDQPKGSPHTPPAAPGSLQTTPRRSEIPPTLASAPQRAAERARDSVTEARIMHQAIRRRAEADPAIQRAPGRRRVLDALLSFASDSTWCWPSVQAIAETADVDEATARRALRWLETHHYISTRQRGWQTSIYQLIAARGAQLHPTCDLEILTQIEPDVASRGGRGEPAAERDSAGLEPVLAAEMAAVVSWPDGASYDPAADVTAQAETAPARSWGVGLRPRELYAFCHAARDAAARSWMRADQPDAGAQGETQQLAIARALGDRADQDAPAEPQPLAAAGLASGPQPAQRQIPTDPQQRRRYFALLGKAKKSKSAAQARHLRELAAALLVEVTSDDQAGPPAPPVGRTRARPATPRATAIVPAQTALGLELPREEASGPAAAPPTSSPVWALEEGDVWLEQQRQNLRAAEARGDGAKVAFYRYVLGEGPAPAPRVEVRTG